MVNDQKAVQRQTAQYDLFNRLHSIAGDEAFVRDIAGHYGGKYQVIANQRCGTWYCDPSSSSSTYAYFKSTDGHTGTWNFNLRRSNLALASRLEELGGAILVDSTRRGKRMPDALSKTVPVWCTVINRAVAQRDGKQDDPAWDTSLHLPPVISPSERSQIEALLPAWVESLLSSSLALPQLTKPLRPFWIHPAIRTPPSIPPDAAYTPLICVSASRWVGSEDDVPAVTKVGGGRTVGFSYVQGAGDDDELWSRGLTPAVFYRHKSSILEADKDDLPDTVDDLVKSAHTDKLSASLLSLNIDDSIPSIHTGPDDISNIHALTGVPSPTSRLSVQLGPPITSQPPWSPSSAKPHTSESSRHTIRIVLADKQRYPPWCHAYTDDITIFACPSARAEGKAFGMALDELVDHLDGVMDRHPKAAFALALGAESDLEAARSILQSEQSANDGKASGRDAPLNRPSLASVHPTSERMLEYRKAIIPIALVLLLSNPDLLGVAKHGIDMRDIGKKDISDMLHRLVALWPDGNPPRAALKRVNEYLMSPYA